MEDIKIAGRIKVVNLKNEKNNIAMSLYDGDSVAISNDIIRKTKDIAAPEGYLTGDEFESRCIANITKFYNERGLL